MTAAETRLAVSSALNQYAPADLVTLAQVACCSSEDALLSLYELRDAGYARVVARGAGMAAQDQWGWTSHLDS